MNKRVFRKCLSLILVCCITLSAVGCDKKSEYDGENVDPNDGIVNKYEISFDAISKECPDCLLALQDNIILTGAGATYFNTQELERLYYKDGEQPNGIPYAVVEDEVTGEKKYYPRSDITYMDKDGNTQKEVEEKLSYIADVLYNDMHHNCMAEKITVEEIPYVYKGAYGLYSGEWQGAGPVGQGTFVGFKPDFKTDASFIAPRDGEYMVKYTGEWAYGLPEGEGELIQENAYNSTWNQTYSGGMYAGRRDGVGALLEYRKGTLVTGDYYEYRFYEDGTFQSDVLMADITYEEYDGYTEQFLARGVARGDKDGSMYEISHITPEDMQKQVEDALVLGATVISMAVLAKIMLSSTSKPYSETAAGKWEAKYKENLNKELDEWRQKKAQEEQESLKRQAEEAEAFRQWNEDQYYKLHEKDPSDWSLDAQRFKANMY